MGTGQIVSSFSIRSMRQEEVYKLKPLVVDFLKSSKDYEMNVAATLMQMKDAAGNQSAWVITNERLHGQQLFWEDIAGYFYVTIQTAEYGGLVAVINQLFIVPHFRGEALVHYVDNFISDWASRLGVREVAFYTRRNLAPFLRKLGGNWKFDSYVIKKQLPT